MCEWVAQLPRVGLQLEAGELSASNGERSPWAETPTSVASESRRAPLSVYVLRSTVEA
jgi:hypothetical protein